MAVSAEARAHTVGASRLAIEGDRLALVFAAGELGALYPLHDLGRATPLLVADTWDRLDLAVDGVPCEPGAPVLRSVEGDGLALEGTHGCAGGGTLTIVAGYLQTFEIGHEAEVEVDGRIVASLDRGSPIARVALPPAGEPAGRLLLLGALVIAGIALLATAGRRARSAG